MDALIKDGQVTRGWLGVQVRKTTDEEAVAASIEKGSGLFVVKTVDGGPAAGAGVVAGDVIAMLNGKAVHDVVPFAWDVGNLPSSSQVTLDIVRKGGRKNVAVTLGHMPDSATATSSAARRLLAPP